MNDEQRRQDLADFLRTRRIRLSPEKEEAMIKHPHPLQLTCIVSVLAHPAGVFAPHAAHGEE
jgi:hypothetical protein